MNWLTKIISEHAYTTAADQSAILSFLRWTNSKCEEEDPSKTKTPTMEKRLKFWAFRIPLLCFVESFSVCLLPEPASLPLTKVFLQLLVLSAAVGCIWDLSAVTYHPRDFTSVPSNSATGREMNPVTCITVYQRMTRTHAMTTLSQSHRLCAKQKSYQQRGAF